MSVNIEASGSIKSIINDEIVANAAFDSHYDGKELKIKGFSDGEQFYMQLDNEAIKDILAMPSHQSSLEDRLMKNFNKPKKTHKKSKKSTNKKTRRRTKSK